VTSVDEPRDNPYFSPGAHRVLWIVAWVLFALGMLAWFVQGANRPLDPVVSPALILIPLALRRFV
jgi:hypothetical protein